MSTHYDYDKHVGFRDILLDSLREAVQDVLHLHEQNPRMIFDETNHYCILATICVERCITFGLKRSGLFTTRDLYELLKNGSQASKDPNIQGDFMHVNNLLLSKMGKARAWIRYSINQKHLASSLYALASNRPFIKSWFEDYAIMPTVVVNDLHQEIEKLESLHFNFNLRDSQLDNTEIYDSDPNVYRSLHKLKSIELDESEPQPTDTFEEVSVSHTREPLEQPPQQPPPPPEESIPQSPEMTPRDIISPQSSIEIDEEMNGSLNNSLGNDTPKTKKKRGKKKGKEKKKKSSRRILLESDGGEDDSSSVHNSPGSDEPKKPKSKRKKRKSSTSQPVVDEEVVEAPEEPNRHGRSSSADYDDPTQESSFARTRAQSTPQIQVMNNLRQARRGMVPFSAQINRSNPIPMSRSRVPPLQVPKLGDRSGPLDTPSILRPVSPSEGHWACHLQKRQNSSELTNTDGVLSFDQQENFDDPEAFAIEDEIFDQDLEEEPSAADLEAMGLGDLNITSDGPVSNKSADAIMLESERDDVVLSPGSSHTFSPKLNDIIEEEDPEQHRKSLNKHMQIPPEARQQDPPKTEPETPEVHDISTFMRKSYIPSSRENEQRKQDRRLRESLLLRGENQSVTDGGMLMPSTGVILSNPTISEGDMYALQGGECFGCGTRMPSLEQAYLCYYAFKLYCGDCMGIEEIVDGTQTSTSSSNSDEPRFKYSCTIPARVLDSLDLHLYAVSKNAAEHLQNMYYVPAIPLSQCAPSISNTSRIRHLGKKLDALGEIKLFIDQCPKSRALKNLLGARQYLLSSFVTDRDLFGAIADPSVLQSPSSSKSDKKKRRKGGSSSLSQRRRPSHSSQNVFGMVSMNDMMCLIQANLASELDSIIRQYVHHIQDECKTCKSRGARGEHKLWRKLDRCGIQI